jgi:UDP:flavonoid glycosyltransferase YjiC (YdhE family)
MPRDQAKVGEYMTRHAVLTSLPFFGHLGPQLAQGDRLVERGWRVSVASLEDAQQYLREHPQLEFVSLGRADLTQQEIDELRDSISRSTSFSQTMLSTAKTLARGWVEAYDATLALLDRERPQVLVADLSSTAAISAAERLGIACVVNNPDLLTVLPVGVLPPAPEVPLLLSGKSINSIGQLDRYLYPVQRYVGAMLANALVGRPLNAARRSRGLKNVNFQHWLADKQILVNSAFGLEYPRRLPPNVHMVGPMFTESSESLPAEYAGWLSDGKPVVYVNLGTIARPWRELLQRMAEAFRTEHFRTLWVVPSDLQPLLPNDLPETVRVERWVPSQLAVLSHPNVRAFVSHCGVNSVHEAIWAGTPVIGMPLFAAQGDMALRVQDARVGSRVDKHRFTPEQLRAQILAACTDEAMRANIATLRQTFVAAGGVRRAAELIEQAASGSSSTPPYAARLA